MTTQIDIELHAFKTQLIQLKENYKSDSFGFLQDHNINYDHVEMLENTIKVSRNAHMLSPFRGVGDIVGQLSESHELKIVIDYDVKPYISLKQYSIFLILSFGIWITCTIYFEEWLLSLAGSLLAGLFFIAVYFFNRYQVNSLDNYFRQVLEEIKKAYK